MTDGSPTVPARRLGKTLKRLRDTAGKSQVQAAEWVSTVSSSISKYETADRTPSESHLKLMLQCYGVDWESPLGVELLQLGKQAREPGWWADYGDVIPAWFIDRIGLETAASELWIYESGAIPGLLQTTEYAQAVITALNSSGPPDNAERIAAVRMARRRRLDDAGRPLVLRVVLDEAVLSREIGGPSVMLEQVTALIEAARRDNITLQVLPFSAGAHPAQGGPFTTIRFSEQEMDTVYVELRGGAVYLDRSVDVERYVATFEQLRTLSLAEDETVLFLEKIERRYR